VAIAAPALRRTAAAARAYVLNDLMNADNRGLVVKDDGDKDYVEEAAKDDKARPTSAKD